MFSKENRTSSENSYDFIPLSYIQQGYLYLHNMRLQSDKELPISITCSFKYNKELDIQKFKKVFYRIVDKNKLLRATVADCDGIKGLIIHPSITLSIPVIRLGGYPKENKNNYIDKFIEQESQKDFDLINGPLFRCSILETNQDEFLIVIDIHRILADSYSVKSIIKNLMTSYEQNNFSDDQNIKLRLTDCDNRKDAKNVDISKQLNYWMKKLKDAPNNLNLPIDKPKRETLNFQPASYSIPVDNGLVVKLKEIANKEGTLLINLLLTAYNVLLYRYSGQTDILVGIPNNIRRINDDLIGSYDTSLVVRTRINGQETFLNLFRTVIKELKDDYAYSDISFEQLVAELNPSSHNQKPFFQTMFSINNNNNDIITILDKKIKLNFIFNEEVKVDLYLNLVEENNTIKINLVYNSSLFSIITIERFVNHYINLLNEIIKNPNRKLLKFPILSKEETKQYLEDWSGAKNIQNLPKEFTILHAFEQLVNKNPNKTAITVNNDKLTYKQWNEKANQIAHYLRMRGVKPDDLIGISMKHSTNLMITILGIWKSGAAYLPLDPNYPSSRLESMLEISQPKLLITESYFSSKRKDSTILYTELIKQISRMPSTNLNIICKPNNLAYVIFTSGTTGEPKGVMIEHHSLITAGYGWKKEYNLDEDTRILNVTGISFDVFSGDLIKTIISGGSLILSPSVYKTEMRLLYQIMIKERITYVLSTPGLIISFLNYLFDNGLDVPNLEILEMGGDYLPINEYKTQIKRFKNRFKITNAYGVTEATVESSSYVAQGDLIEDTLSGYVPIGRPVCGALYYVLNEELVPQPCGVLGELYIGGSFVGRGYYNREELTDERFIANPYIKGERLYKTGDIVRWSKKGYIEFFGRRDHQIKIRGYRIEIGEIVSVLNKHKFIKDVAVIVKEDPTWGKRLFAFLVAKDKRFLDTSNIKNYLKKELPSHMIPSEFIWLDKLPYTNNGKVDRALLEKYKTERVIESKTIENTVPRDYFEFEVQKIWQTVLNINTLFLKDSFFDVGGHSLALISLQSQITKKFKKDIPLSLLYKNSTIEQMAALLRKNTKIEKQSPIISLSDNKRKEPIFFIHQIGGYCFRYRHLARKLEEKYSLYGIQISNPFGDYDSIVEMASKYNSLIKKHYESGPIHLVGHSLGGNIAFEMALQLQNSGGNPGILAILDSSLPPIINNGWKISNFDLLVDYIKDRFPISHEEIGILYKLTESERVRKVLHLGKAAGYYRKDMDTEQLERVLSVFTRHKKAWLLHKMPRDKYNNKVLFFHALKESRDSRVGWSDYINQKMKIFSLETDHYEIVEEPIVTTIAEIIDNEISEMIKTFI